jgi:ABC-type branched-subunit amino acid transport system ATPase component
VSSAEPLLDVRGVAHSFGGVRAVDDCSFEVGAGSISALIGPNGAGKTTLVNCVSGALACEDGEVRFAGTDITNLPSRRVAGQGLIRTFQISREFGSLTVTENLLVTAPRQAGERLYNALLRPGLGKREDARNLERALTLLDTFGLFEMRDEYARNLSGGQKRLLELARAMIAEPKLLLLDEPMAGVNPALIEQISQHLLDFRDEGITFLMVEHNLNVVEQICDHVVVMASGRTLATGLMSELRANPEVVRAYLGGALEERPGSPAR